MFFLLKTFLHLLMIDPAVESLHDLTDVPDI